MTADADFAASYLRKIDRDRYLATLLLEPEQRAAITALYAFNADVATIRDRAREPAAGEIRLQWWKDALEGQGHGGVRQNPLAAVLLDAVAKYRLPVPALTRLLTARRFDLYDDAMPDVPTFEGYAGETVSALYQLAAMVLNTGIPVETGDAAGHLGVAQALVGHLRAFGYYAAQGRIFLPWSLLAANGVEEREIFSGTNSEGLAEALGQLSEMAQGHLDKASSAIVRLPRGLRGGFASVAVLTAQLSRLDVESPFQPQRDLADWQKIARLGWWKLRSG
ncbi:MAG: phytoene/squalene synthase family protein [Devosia sp.]